jgi:hypothetical protein
MINPVFATTAVIGLALPMLPTKSPQAERRLYWSGTVVASVSAFFALYPPDWRGGLAIAAVLAGGMFLRAYMSTRYIRIRGRTYAFNLSDSDSEPGCANSDSDDLAPDSYGGMATATKAWWLLVVIVAACTFVVWIWLAEQKGPWYAAGAVATVAIAAISIGYQDGSWEYPIARGQLLQFTLVGVASIGIFAALYSVTYAAGRRWPLHPRGAADYRAHPHLRRKFPQ